MINLLQLWEEVSKSRSRRERWMITGKSQTGCPGEMEQVGKLNSLRNDQNQSWRIYGRTIHGKFLFCVAAAFGKLMMAWGYW